MSLFRICDFADITKDSVPIRLNVCARVCLTCICMYVCVCVHTFKSYVRVFRGFFNGWLCTLVLDYKFHNLILHSNFNPLAIPHTHTHTHTHIRRFNACTLARCASLNREFQSWFYYSIYYRYFAFAPYLPPPLFRLNSFLH